MVFFLYLLLFHAPLNVEGKKNSGVNDFGGDFGSLSGAPAPGPGPDTMGIQFLGFGASVIVCCTAINIFSNSIIISFAKASRFHEELQET